MVSLPSVTVSSVGSVGSADGAELSGEVVGSVVLEPAQPASARALAAARTVMRVAMRIGAPREDRWDGPASARRQGKGTPRASSSLCQVVIGRGEAARRRWADGG